MSANAAWRTVAGDRRVCDGIRRSQPERPVRAMGVVVLGVDAQDPLQMPSPGDQEPVQTLGADCANPPLRVGVGVGRPHRCHQHLGALGPKHVVEAAAELGVTVTDEEAHPPAALAKRQQQVAGLLGDPGAVRVGRHPGQVDSAGVQFDEEQHVQPPQPYGVDGEEVARDDPRCLLAQERPPRGARTPRRRVEAVAVQHRADRGRRDPDTQADQLALDALIAPARVLPGQPDDQLLDLRVQRWPADPVWVGPRTGDQPPMPAQQRLGLDQEARPMSPGQDATDRGKQRPVGGLQPGTWSLAAQDRELVAQHQDLEVLGGVAAGEQREQLDGATQREVSKFR